RPRRDNGSRRGRRVRHRAPPLVRSGERPAGRDPEHPQPRGRADARAGCASPYEPRPVSAAAAGQGAPPLLETKLHAPRRRPGAIGRTRLTDRLDAAKLPPLTLVSAPAGFGKTTLLADSFTDTEREGR